VSNCPDASRLRPTVRSDPLPPLRICYVLSHFHPIASGAERQALAQGTELVRRGHTVHVVTHAIPGAARDDALSGVRVHRWVDTARAGRLFGLVFVAGVIRALRRLRGDYDLIHTHQGLWEAVATGVGRPALGGVPVLVQPASSGYFGEAEELLRTRGAPLLRRAILRNHAFAAISADIEQQWLRLGVAPGRLARMASGVDADHFRAGPIAAPVEAQLGPRPRVVFTGRLHPQKNLETLVDAWPAVVRRTGARLILVGEGPDRERLAARAESRGVAAHIRWLGAVDDPSEILRGADAFALPSVAEGMSNSLLEAMATSLPCLASRIGGNIDLLEEGRTGRLLPPHDVDAWSSAIVQVLDDHQLARRLGTAARQRVEAEFALPVVVDRYLGLYRRMLAGMWPT
jgi:glycosyltransferase involved in cell wall biosynthesis